MRTDLVLFSGRLLYDPKINHTCVYLSHTGRTGLVQQVLHMFID